MIAGGTPNKNNHTTERIHMKTRYGFSNGYMREEFLNHCKYEDTPDGTVFVPIERGEYRFIAFDFGVSIRLVFEDLQQILYTYSTSQDEDNKVHLIFKYVTEYEAKEIEIDLDNTNLLEFSFSKTVGK